MATNWKDILNEVNAHKQKHGLLAQSSVDIIRRKYLQKLFKYTGRNLIAYYSGFLSKPNLPSDIRDEDMNGFMMVIHGLADRNQGLDIILHTEGGNLAATQAIVFYLRKMFGNNIRAIVPQISMSAGTMMACSCKKILMTKHSNLGPIDPQFGGIPAYGVIKEFERAFNEVQVDPSKLGIWQTIIGQYRPTFLSQCENAIDRSKEFVIEQLMKVMFSEHPDPKGIATKAVEALTDYDGNKGHDRHIDATECKDKIGLEIEYIEDDQHLQDLILPIHHCFMHSLMNTQAYKMIENHLGHAFVKKQQQMVMQQQ